MSGGGAHMVQKTRAPHCTTAESDFPFLPLHLQDICSQMFVLAPSLSTAKLPTLSSFSMRGVECACVGERDMDVHA